MRRAIQSANMTVVERSNWPPHGDEGGLRMRPEVFVAVGLVFGGFVVALTDNIPLCA